MIMENDFNVFTHVSPAVRADSVEDIPRWHFAMLNDRERNHAFFNAICSADLEGKTVLDIGTGSGLLAMIAAQRGAKHVYTCESNPLIAQKAQEIISQNALSEKITVIPKLSTELVPGVDLPNNIDVLISETVDCGFFGEGFGLSLVHAKEKLLKPDAEIIPQGVELFAGLLSSQDIANLNSVNSKILGLDVSSFNAFSTSGYFPVRLNTWSHSFKSAPVRFYRAGFTESFTFENSSKVQFVSNAEGICHGIIFWFKIYLYDNITLSNDPGNFNSHWMQAVHLLGDPVMLCSGRAYALDLEMSVHGIKFSKRLCYSDLDSAA